MPLLSIHPHAFKAAEAANCANEQGKFWPMYELLFQNQRALGPAQLPQHAQTLGLDLPKFNECLASGRHAAEVRKDMADADSANVQGTPNFIIGIVNPKNPRDPNIKVVKTITGAAPYLTFKVALDAALDAASKQQ